MLVEGDCLLERGVDLALGRWVLEALCLSLLLLASLSLACLSLMYALGSNLGNLAPAGEGVLALVRTSDGPELEPLLDALFLENTPTLSLLSLLPLSRDALRAALRAVLRAVLLAVLLAHCALPGVIAAERGRDFVLEREALWLEREAL